MLDWVRSACFGTSDGRVIMLRIYSELVANSDLFFFFFFFLELAFKTFPWKMERKAVIKSNSRASLVMCFLDPPFSLFSFLLSLNPPGLKLNSLHQHMAKVGVRQIKRFIALKNG